MWGIGAIGFAVFAFGLVSGRLKDSYVTLPIIFILFGLVVGNGGLQLIDAPVSHGAIHVLAEITLALILFSDAARIDLRLLLSDHDLPARTLAIGMPLTIALGKLWAGFCRWVSGWQKPPCWQLSWLKRMQRYDNRLFRIARSRSAYVRHST